MARMFRLEGKRGRSDGSTSRVPCHIEPAAAQVEVTEEEQDLTVFRRLLGARVENWLRVGGLVMMTVGGLSLATESLMCFLAEQASQGHGTLDKLMGILLEGGLRGGLMAVAESCITVVMRGLLFRGLGDVLDLIKKSWRPPRRLESGWYETLGVFVALVLITTGVIGGISVAGFAMFGKYTSQWATWSVPSPLIAVQQILDVIEIALRPMLSGAALLGVAQGVLLLASRSNRGRALGQH